MSLAIFSRFDRHLSGAIFNRSAVFDHSIYRLLAHRWVTLLCSVVFVSLSSLAAHAKVDMTGIFDVVLIEPNDAETTIGEIEFRDNGKITTFTIELNAPVFADHFLSMRPFRCIEGPDDWYCHLPYPYKSRRIVESDDLVDLEYALLFISKQRDEFGIDAWNGRYFKLKPVPDQPNVLYEGTLHEVDLNILAVPPADAFARPVVDRHLTEADVATSRFPKLRIQVKR